MIGVVCLEVHAQQTTEIERRIKILLNMRSILHAFALATDKGRHARLHGHDDQRKLSPPRSLPQQNQGAGVIER